MPACGGQSVADTPFPAPVVHDGIRQPQGTGRPARSTTCSDAGEPGPVPVEAIAIGLCQRHAHGPMETRRRDTSRGTGARVPVAAQRPAWPRTARCRRVERIAAH